MPLTAHRRTGLSPFFLVTNLLIWISAVIVMGIVSYWISQGAGGDHIIYEEVISVLTVAFFLVSFILGTYPGYILMFNLIFSYLWLVAVAFTASDFSNSKSNLALTVEAFSFIAFFLLFFNVAYDWYMGYHGGAAGTRTTTTSRV
ncbi:uncharacterized protein E0L32_002113 [Thyridium curvatum]|uniref:MARVEL domain-containing protein n=1 Tax=Thyridium curvatum TaxID=1093900 RepID=A0A507AKB3_9PEZI|nr:uncharacterized protein E0L32_002020 [Thyridium curvatum]XP_030989221.1 uncharacterized protein E0L32_002113 [Thyridium curvatum]TPX07417.1 hypothetical protein E0L32_002020 [Thyridium curvatum]TPX07510.1 hypothetical protein E0L32_002113 [Thyridium curvatum]